MDARLARLRWRSRRGMRELDAVLHAFLDANDPDRRRNRPIRGDSRAARPDAARLPSRAQCSNRRTSPPPSSSAFAPAIGLRPSPSRLLVHLVVRLARPAGRGGVARRLACGPEGRRARRDRRPRRRAAAASRAGGRCSSGPTPACLVPEWGVSACAARAANASCARYWIRLDVGVGRAPTRHIAAHRPARARTQWARLRALLERARCDAPHVSSPAERNQSELESIHAPSRRPHS